MPAATPRLYFQTLCEHTEHEVFRVISTMIAGSLCRVMLTMATRSMFFFYFSEKRHKIVEFFALLTTELSSYKCVK